MSAYLNKRNPPLTESSRNDSERMWFLPNSDMKAHCVNLMGRNQLRLIQCRQILRAVEDALIQTFGNCVCSDLIKAGRTVQKERRQIKGKPEAHFYRCVASVATFFRLLLFITSGRAVKYCICNSLSQLHNYTRITGNRFRRGQWKISYQRNQSVRVDRIWQMCTDPAETKCLYRTCWNKMYVQEALKQNTCTGPAETKCMYRKCW